MSAAESKQTSHQIVVISGAASGIGQALAREYAKSACKLALLDVQAVPLLALAQELTAKGIQVLPMVGDVANVHHWVEFARRVSSELGPADVVVNNAGVSLLDSIASTSEADAQWILGINFWGVFHGSRAFLPQITRKPGGVIINISSIFAMVSSPTQGLYNATKAAVRGLTDALREELRDHGTQVLCVHPGGIQTNIAKAGRVGDVSATISKPMNIPEFFNTQAINTAEHAAQRIVAAQRSGKTRLLIGTDAKFLDLLFRLAPSRSSQWFSGIMRSKLRKAGMWGGRP
jgi:short-subunit dehydrogenase